ncbi:MAG: asparagine synthetase B family protein [Nevskiaceae bacterium]
MDRARRHAAERRARRRATLSTVQAARSRRFAAARMSGFVGVFHRDGQPVDAAQLESLTQALRFRGPDGSKIWAQGSIGFGHARFIVDRSRDNAPQPLGLDRRLWLAGDVRLDARAVLRDRLHAAGQRPPPDAGDAVLVLHAYAAWGRACAEHVDGDFSFAVWDETRRRLFCARDRFGVKPLFYAAFDDLVLVGNTLGVLRRHPRVGARLDDRAVADFLLAGQPLEPDATFFADVRRLPAAHTLEVDAVACSAHRYWSLPVEPLVRHAQAADYVAGFADVLTQAVADRVDGAAATLEMSGGLDSAALAAALTGKLGAWRPAASVRGVCHGFNRSFADPEPALAREAARALGLELEVWEHDSVAPFATDEPGTSGPEPSLADLFRGSTARNLRRLAALAPAILNGQGGDEVLACDPLIDELAASRDPRLLADWFATARRSRHPAIGLRGLLARRQRRRRPTAIPEWLRSGWVGPVDLRERVDAANSHIRSAAGPRPAVRRRLSARLWQPYLEAWDSGMTGICVEARFPYLDRRVVEWCLRLPPYPWCLDKRLLRDLLGRWVPQSVSRRPKTPLQGDPLIHYLEAHRDWRATLAWAAEELAPWLEPPAWRHACEALDPARHPDLAWELMRGVALAWWLRLSKRGVEPAALA